MTYTLTLTEDEHNLLTHCLYMAKEQFAKDAFDCARLANETDRSESFSEGIRRLGVTFDTQVDDTRNLIDKLEDLPNDES